MIKTSQPILFFGTEQFSLASLRELVESGVRIAAVITKPDSKKGRGHKLSAPEVKDFALKHAIDVYQPSSTQELREIVAQYDRPIGILVSFGRIIPQDVLDAFSPGIINVHPSLLPYYRGPSPIESAIINGDTETGISIMQLTADMDAGPVYTQEKLVLSGSETQAELYDTLGALGAKKLLQALPSIINGTLLPEPQDQSRATYCSLLNKSMSLIDPATMTASEIDRHVRAYHLFPKTKVTIDGHTIIVIAGRISQTKTALALSCKDGLFYSIESLVAPSGKHIDAAGFVNGYLS